MGAAEIILAGVFAVAIAIYAVKALVPVMTAVVNSVATAVENVKEKVQDKTKNKKDPERNHKVYVLVNKQNQVKYVGRTKNSPQKRESEHHKVEGREDLKKLVVIAKNLTRNEARGLEEALIFGFDTYHPKEKGYNQIHGISPTNPKRLYYFVYGASKAAFLDENLVKIEDGQYLFIGDVSTME